jgi:HD-GYP domain-containing protein (c-di-GMP phosphodiesterase class II)
VVQLASSEEDLVECAKSRISVVKNDESVASEAKRTLCVPMEIAGRLAGVFRFVRHGGEAFHTRDADMVLMFMKQVALCIENRDMVNHRETFYLELVQTLADILDAKDASMEGHTRRMRSLARAIGRELHMPDEFIYYLEFAALMHDIGKIGIDESLLKKPGKLTAEEFAIIKKHPELGHKILAPVTMLAPVAPMVLYHQEWFNGKGYPEGLSGEEIPLGARIVAIIDAYSAMSSSRPWRPALTDAQVIEEVRKGAGTQFDPKVVDAFLSVMQRQQLAA